LKLDMLTSEGMQFDIIARLDRQRDKIRHWPYRLQRRTSEK
jgi:hypothetical protein